MRKLVLSGTVGIFLATVYGYFAIYTTALKGTGLDILFISSGIPLAPLGACILWLFEKVGFISDPGMASGFVMFAYGGYVLWAAVFSALLFFALKRVFTRCGGH